MLGDEICQMLLSGLIVVCSRSQAYKFQVEKIKVCRDSVEQSVRVDAFIKRSLELR